MKLEWVAIQDKFPEDMEDILVYDELEGEFLGYYFSSTKMFIRYADGSTFENVTHWMPLSAFRKKLKLQLGNI